MVKFTFEEVEVVVSNARANISHSRPQLVWQNSFDKPCRRGTADAAPTAFRDGYFPASLKGRDGARALQSGSVTLGVRDNMMTSTTTATIMKMTTAAAMMRRRGHDR